MTLTVCNDPSPWQVSPAAVHHRRVAWQGGAFETARRERTASVEGVIRSSSHLVMATLKGGARVHEFVTEEGFRYKGQDKAGFVSFLPAGCERRLSLSDVAWEWASIALPPKVAFSTENVGPFSEANNEFLFGMLKHFRLLFDADGALDVTYCDAMTFALTQYLKHRGSSGKAEAQNVRGGLPPRKLRTVTEYIDANLGGEIRIRELARLVDRSEGHFHRAFRSTTGKTPLQFVNERRVGRAAEILAARPDSILDVALQVGFVSASHFARTFRRVTGVNPDRYRRDF